MTNFVTIVTAVLMLTPPVNVLDAVIDARAENNPVLPDDLGGAEVSAVWETPPVQQPEVMPSVTLYTADGSWCGPCNRLSKALGLDKSKRTVSAKLPFKLNIVFCPKEGNSPTGGVPCMQIDGTSTRRQGSGTVSSIISWYNRNAKPVNVAQAAPTSDTVVISGWNHARGEAAARALVAHLNRQTCDDECDPRVMQGIFDPKVEVDIQDSIVDFINALTTTGAKIGPATITWPEGSVDFNPPVKLTVKKIIKLQAALRSIEFTGSELAFRLDGLIDLTVRFK